MKLIISKKMMIWTAVIAVTSVLLYNLPFILLKDRLLTSEVGKILRKNLAKYGMNVAIGKIHWAGGGKFEAAMVSLNELQGGALVAGAEKLVLKTNLWALAGSLRDPEAVLREVEISGPRLRLQHFADGTWNFSPLFTGKKKKTEIRFSLNIVIRNGTVDWEDYRFGRHRFQQVDGRVDLRKYPLITWDLKGKSDWGDPLAWKSAGKMRTDQSAGTGKVDFSGLPLAKAYRLLPRQYSCKVIAGKARGLVEFGWEESRFWLEQGRAELEQARVGIPQLHDPLWVKSGEVRFSPRQIWITRSRISYRNTDLQAYGRLIPGTSSVNIVMNSKRARLEDILELFPEIPKTQVQGSAKLRLKMAGSINNPVFNGDLSLAGVRVVSNGETFTDISGRATVKRNNIFLDHFAGNWDGSVITANGVMKNIYNPILNLDVTADGLRLAQFQLDRLDGVGLKMDEPAAFHGKLSGEWNALRLSGEAAVNRLECNRITAQELKVQLAWEPTVRKLQILALNGKVWGGCLAVDGRVTIEPQGSRWEVSGKIAGADVSAVTILPDVGLQTGKIDANGLWKGSWKPGEPFEPGSVTGVIRGRGITYMDTIAGDVTAVYSWDKDVMRVDSIQAKLGAGRIFGNLVLDQSCLTADISAENIQLESVFPKKYRLPVKGAFQGSLRLEGAMNDLSASMNGGFKNLVWEDKLIGNVTGNIRYRLKEKEVHIDQMVVNNLSGDYSVAGDISLKPEAPPDVNIRIDTDNFDLKGLMSWLPADRQLQVDGSGRANLEIKGSWATPHIYGKLYLAQPRFANIMMNEGVVEIRGDLNRLEIIQCQLLSEETRISLTGWVERNKLSLSIGGNCGNLERFKLSYGGKQLKGKVNLSGNLEGDLQNPVLSVALDGETIGFGNLQYPQLTAKIRWLAPRLEIYDAVLGGGDNVIRVNGNIYTDNPVRFDLVFDVEQFRIEEIMKMADIEQIAAAGRFNGKINLSGSAAEPKCRLTGDITEGTINHVAVNGEVNLFYAANKLTIEKVLLKHDTGTFKLYGAWEKGRKLRLKGNLNGFPLETVNSFIPKSKLKLAGLADADFDLVWGGQVFQGDFALNGQNLQINEEMFGACSFKGSVTETGFTIKSGNLNVKNGSLEVTGRIPWPDNLRAALKMSASPVAFDTAAELDMTLRDIPTNLLDAYAVGFTVKDGVVNGQVKLNWAAGKPRISGKIDCSGAQLSVPDLPLTVNMIQASVILQKNRALIERASGTIAKGRVDLSGEIDFSDWKRPSFNLDCTGSKVFFKNYFYDGMGDFDLKLAGPWDDTLLMGNITVYNCKVGGLTLARPGGAREGWNPRVDLMVKIGNKARFRQIGVADLSVEGSLHIKGLLMQPQLGGEVTSRQGVVTFYSQTFKVNRGEAVFSYSQGFNPFVDVEASLITPKAEVIVTLKGQIGTELVPVLSSRPALSQKEIFALLDWSDLNGEKPLTLDSMVSGNLGAVTDTLFGDLFFQIGDVLNVDYFYLETDYRSNEYRLSVGDYITDKLFVSYTRSVLTPVEKEELEKWSYDYHLTSKLALGGSYTLEEGHSWRLSYTFKF